MTNLEIELSTYNENGELTQIISIFEGNLRIFSWVLCDELDQVAEDFIGGMESLYPKIWETDDALFDGLIDCLKRDRQTILQTSFPTEPIVSLLIVQGVDPEDLRKHISCKEAHRRVKNEVVTRKYAKENGLPDVDLKQVLKCLDQNSTEMTFFTQSSCPVCLLNYKKIIKKGHHIVIPFCGHPVCCKCCDNLLRNDGRCPICRKKYNVSRFDIMKFDINSRQLPHEGNLYL